MKVLHLFAEKPSPLAVRIMDGQSRDHKIKSIQLLGNAVSYDDVVDEIFATDKVISWNG
jgi:hypothetical protein